MLQRTYTAIRLQDCVRTMAFNLPPLNTLRLFEAAGRHASFKLAAEELHLTPSAVSHGIQKLEDWLGATLFERGTRGLSLTAAGEAYLPQIAEALGMLAQATDVVQGRKPTGALSVSVAPTFAKRWLLPRLARFTERHPDIRVTIDTSKRPVEFPLDGMDLAIRMSAEARAAGTWIELLREELVPVCAPALLAKLGAGSLEELLARAPLIHVTTTAEDWAAWLRATGHAGLSVEGGIRVDRVQVALEAAAQGLGIALGRRPLVDADLDAGRLVMLPAPVVEGATRYWLVGGDETFERPEIRKFRKWLLEEIGSDYPSASAQRSACAAR